MSSTDTSGRGPEGLGSCNTSDGSCISIGAPTAAPNGHISIQPALRGSPSPTFSRGSGSAAAAPATPANASSKAITATTGGGATAATHIVAAPARHTSTQTSLPLTENIPGLLVEISDQGPSAVPFRS
ncbi:hypothetical protein LQ327_28615 [Actinomycetospora endophytica]|uniref:Uncharacterized protein n=1 Tax=Actinomycetospora endophytica TaxID=2291215 RepID=A0ABS8PGJ0_9PSEU|nr:hypothetical protein [Actinomycetospora endophytica]